MARPEQVMFFSQSVYEKGLNLPMLRKLHRTSGAALSQHAADTFVE